MRIPKFLEASGTIGFVHRPLAVYGTLPEWF